MFMPHNMQPFVFQVDAVILTDTDMCIILHT
ncbi:hypothetical protein SAMN05444421_1186 [Celeribacter marinus]|nr:hypothetical protein SAMN05444421_1186 [Celeribacter marinus]